MSELQSNAAHHLYQNPLKSNAVHNPYQNPLSSSHIVLPPYLMYGMGTRTFWCVMRDSPGPFKISVHPDADVYDFKRIIIQEKKALRDYDASELVLWKLNDPEPVQPARTIGQRIELRGDVTTFAKELDDPTQKVSLAFPQSQFLENHVYMLVDPPPDASVPLDQSLSHRTDTVTALYEKLKAYHLILVRGTPASGKTVLTRLLDAHIRQQDPTVKKILQIRSWPPIAGRDSYDSILRKKGWVEHKKTVFIFDEGQLTYNDWELWNNFFKSIHEGKGLRRAIIFASYGSPTSRIIIAENTPMELPDRQQVTLHHMAHGDGLAPAGLLFTKSEFDDLVYHHYRSQPGVYLDQSFYDAVFEITNGHVGAIMDFINIIIADDSYRNLKNLDAGAVYTWDLFMAKVSPQRLLKQLDSTGIFRRGLPLNTDLQDSATARIFSTVLCRGLVKDTDYPDIQSDEKRALERCYRNGWLQADLVEGTAGYFFPSSLHSWHVEWKLWGSVDQIQAKFQADSLLELVINVIRLFSPSRLSAERKLGPGCIQRLPEAQYQDELYRCCHAFSEGSLLTLPEFGMAKGRVDFYVPAKRWGIELLCDGDRLASHWGRFSNGGSYSESLPLTDYIIVDCRTTHPRQGHPCK